MSSTDPTEFEKQKSLASKRVSDLDDKEKIYLLKREIDNLRSQIRGTGVMNSPGAGSGGGYVPSSGSSSSLSSSSSGGMSNFGQFTLLTLLVVVGVAMVARWRRRNPVRATPLYQQAPEMTLTFELQDAHDYDYRAPATAGQEFQIL